MPVAPVVCVPNTAGIELAEYIVPPPSVLIISLLAKNLNPVVLLAARYFTNKVLKFGVLASDPSLTPMTVAITPDVTPLIILLEKSLTVTVLPVKLVLRILIKV